MYKPLNSNLPNCFNKHTQYLKKLACHSIDIEARSRRNNRIFYGLADLRDGDTYGLLSQFLYDTMDIDLDSMCVQRVHRLGSMVKARRTSQTPRRPIIAAFRDYRDISCKMLPNCVDLDMVLIVITL